VIRILAAALIVATPAAYAEQATPASAGGTPGRGACPRAAEVTALAPGVYVRTGRHAAVFEGDSVATLGFIVGDRAVAVIDTGGSEAEGHALRCAIAAVTDRPVRFVINTHVHPDHTLGNVAFTGAGIEFIAHAKFPRAMAMRGAYYIERANDIRGVDWAAERLLVPPTRTVDGELTLDLGNRAIKITALESAHTDHDVIVYDEATKVLFSGDLLFEGHIPVVEASINGWIATLESWAATPGSTTLVPGHGSIAVSPLAAIERNLGYLRALREGTRAAIRSGRGLAHAQEHVAMDAAAAWALASEYHRRNVAAAYVELEWE
jgi:quinoprotein relay system zinc metallohydrolase 2